MKLAFRSTAVLAAALVASSCGLFGDKDEEELKPTKLTDIVTTVDIKRLWNVNVGDDAEFLRVALQPAGDGNRIYAASRDGNVVALHPETGKEFWRTRLDIELSAGPGVGEGLVVVGAADGFLVALDAESGTEKWRANIVGETLARPVIKDDFVVVITIGSRLRAVCGLGGSDRWIVEQ